MALVVEGKKRGNDFLLGQVAAAADNDDAQAALKEGWGDTWRTWRMLWVLTDRC